MRKRMIAVGVATLGIGIAGALTAISPALAGPVSVKGLTTHTVIATATADANSTGEAEATCGAGELLVGGGYVINSLATDWRVFVNGPFNGTTWLVEPVNFDASPLTFSAYAVCATSAPGGNAISAYSTNTVAKQVDVPANDTGVAAAVCPAGELSTGGGFEVDNISSNWSVYSDALLGTDTWNVEIDNEVPLDTMIHSFAICLARANSKPISGLTVSSLHTAATVQGNSVQAADVSCGSHALLTGGGYEMDSIGQSWSIQTSAPVGSDDWQVLAASLDTNSRNFDSIGVCLAKA